MSNIYLLIIFLFYFFLIINAFLQYFNKKSIFSNKEGLTDGTSDGLGDSYTTTPDPNSTSDTSTSVATTLSPSIDGNVIVDSLFNSNVSLLSDTSSDNNVNLVKSMLQQYLDRVNPQVYSNVNTYVIPTIGNITLPSDNSATISNTDVVNGLLTNTDLTTDAASSPLTAALAGPTTSPIPNVLGSATPIPIQTSAPTPAPPVTPAPTPNPGCIVM